jgi:hypothetical protein
VKRYTQKETEALINQGRLALNNALAVAEIAERLAQLNYGPAKLQEGLALCDVLEAQFFAQRHNYKSKNSEGQSVRDLRAEMVKRFSHFRKWGKLIYENEPTMRAELGLDTPLGSGYKARRLQAIEFYKQVLENPAILDAFAARNISQAELAAGRALIDQADQKHEVREQAKGTAQQSTVDRHALAGQFNSWLRSFWKIAEVATADKPQLLEQLGRVVT